MKILSKFLMGAASIGAIVAPIATVVACGESNGGSGNVVITSKDKVPSFVGTKISGKTLGTIVSDPENPRWQKANDNLKANGSAVGFTTTSTIIKSAADQKTWLDSNKTADALIVGATDDSVAGSWTGRPATQPVIAYDRLIKSQTGGAYNWYVTYDNTAVGQLQGASILGSLYGTSFINTDGTPKAQADIVAYATAHKLASKSIVMSMAGDPADNNAKLFFDGAMDILKAVAAVDTNLEIPDFAQDFNKVANAKWDYSTGLTQLQTQIGQVAKDNIKAILAPNDGMATSAMTALKNMALDPKKVYITGQDSNDTAITSLKYETGQNMTIMKPDTVATAVASSLAKDLIEHANHNVADATSLYSEVKANIEKDFNGLSFRIDGNAYSAVGKINTIILTPKVLTHDNVDQYFDVREA